MMHDTSTSPCWYVPYVLYMHISDCTCLHWYMHSTRLTAVNKTTPVFACEVYLVCIHLPASLAFYINLKSARRGWAHGCSSSISLCFSLHEGVPIWHLLYLYGTYSTGNNVDVHAHVHGAPTLMLTQCTKIKQTSRSTNPDMLASITCAFQLCMHASTHACQAC